VPDGQQIRFFPGSVPGDGGEFMASGKIAFTTTQYFSQSSRLAAGSFALIGGAAERTTTWAASFRRATNRRCGANTVWLQWSS
jgi:hypothetical protein